MKVTLKPETIAWLNEQVADGEFASVSEAIDVLVEQEMEINGMLDDIDPSLGPEELAARLMEIAKIHDLDDGDDGGDDAVKPAATPPPAPTKPSKPKS